MMKVVGILLLGLVVLSTSASASTSCFVPRIRALNNQTVYGTMLAASGEQCQIRFNRSLGPIYSTIVVANARHGRVSLDGHKVLYVSQPGYAGEDHFTYARKGLNMRNRPITRTVEVTVRVAAR